MTASIQQDPNAQNVKILLFIMTKHNMQIFGVSSFFKVQNNI